MKKIISILLASVMALAFVGCSKSATPTSGETTTVQESKKVAKNIDAIAEELGYTDGEETFYQMIGARAGKEYDGGSFELYEFGTKTQEYKDIISGEGSLVPASYKDGIVLIIPNNSKINKQEIIDKFENMDFE